MVIGEGSYGKIIRGKLHGTEVAVKIPVGTWVVAGGRAGPAVRALANELRVVRRVSHPNVVHFFGAVVLPAFKRLALVLELVNGQELGSYIKQGSGQRRSHDTKEADTDAAEVLVGPIHVQHVHRPPLAPLLGGGEEGR